MLAQQELMSPGLQAWQDALNLGKLAVWEEARKLAQKFPTFEEMAAALAKEQGHGR